MGKLVKFDPMRRKQNRWTRPSAYGAPKKPTPPRIRRDLKVPLAWLSIVVACALWVLWRGGTLG